MRSTLQDSRILSSFSSDLPHDVDECVYSLLRLCLSRLDHDSLMEQEREVDGRCMEAEVEKSLGYIQCSCAMSVFCLGSSVIDKAVEYELVFADAWNRMLVAILQSLLDVVRGH